MGIHWPLADDPTPPYTGHFLCLDQSPQLKQKQTHTSANSSESDQNVDFRLHLSLSDIPLAWKPTDQKNNFVLFLRCVCGSGRICDESQDFDSENLRVCGWNTLYSGQKKTLQDINLLSKRYLRSTTVLLRARIIPQLITMATETRQNNSPEVGVHRRLCPDSLWKFWSLVSKNKQIKNKTKKSSSPHIKTI